jgi:hypothetical protein
MKIIEYSPNLRIVNFNQLPAGKGLRFLEVVEGKNGEIVAKQWRRSVRKEGVFVKF